MNNDTKIWIHPLSEYQVEYLRDLFHKEVDTLPSHARIHKIAYVDNGSIIVEFTRYGKLIMHEIKNTDTE